MQNSIVKKSLTLGDLPKLFANEKEKQEQKFTKKAYVFHSILSGPLSR